MPPTFPWTLKWFKEKKWWDCKTKKGPRCVGWGPEVMDTCVCPFLCVYECQWSILISPGLWQKFPRSASSVERTCEFLAVSTMRMCRGLGRLIVFREILCLIWCLIIWSPCYDHLLAFITSKLRPSCSPHSFLLRSECQLQSPPERPPKLSLPTQMGCIEAEPIWDLQHDLLQGIG